MSKELIERLKWRIQIRNAMNADRTDPITKDMQESVTAIEALLAERDALAAELKALREQVPVGVVDESDDGLFADLETPDGVVVKQGDKLYAHPVPAEPVNTQLLERISNAMQSYERHGAICMFEGSPMIYASTLTEIADIASEAQQVEKADNLVGLRGCNSRHGGIRSGYPCIYRMRTTDPGCTGCADRDEDQPTKAGDSILGEQK